MAVRRVVTGHTSAGVAIVASDGEVATIDYDVVLEGTVGLELDDGAEGVLGPGDVVVQNGTRHRWHNRGTTIARVLAVTLGAYNDLQGGRAIPTRS